MEVRAPSVFPAIIAEGRSQNGLTSENENRQNHPMTGEQKRPWIQVIPYEQAAGQLKEVYDRTLKSRGRLAEIHKIHSLHPESLVAHMGLYLTLMFGRSPLSRRERELIGVAVSRANGCRYCVAHHSDALSRYEKRADILEAAAQGDWDRLDKKDGRVCRFAELLTLRPSEMEEASLAPLREVGYSDAALLDMVQITAYFNFVNRIVLGLGVPVEALQERQGYKY